ncbi:hypothetical protein [Shinella sp.]|uniref:hypothetical protein n=1 Tax=Shinella sp. TaxID=1870904 RepID=UPI00403564E5
MDKFFFALLNAYIRVSLLLLAIAWGLFGVALYVFPAAYAALWIAKNGGAKEAGGAFIVILLVTGILTFKVKALSRVVEVFHVGHSFLIGCQDKLISELEEVWRKKQLQQHAQK